jgi:plasmid stabilization system protein ParE
MRRFEFTDLALDDLAAVRQWLEQPGAGRAAARRLGQIKRAIKELRLAPCRWPYRDDEGARVRIIERYKIVYEVLPDTGNDATAGDVLVLRIFGPGQLSDRR